MTQIKVDNVVDAVGTGKPDFSDGITIAGGAISSLNLCQYTSSSTEPSSPNNGAIWWDTVNEKYKVYLDGEFKEIELGGGGAAGIAWGGDKVITGSSPSQINTYSISTPANATDWGYDLLYSVGSTGGSVSDTSRAVMAGGYAGGWNNYLQYFTFASAGTAVDFGDLTTISGQGAACSDGTRGVFTKPYTGGANTIDYITIATTGNASVFTSNETGLFWGASGVSDGTRGVFANGANNNAIKYITIQTLGDAVTFGTTTAIGTARGGTGCSDSTYGVFLQANDSPDNGMDYITIATTGNSSEFGDLSVGRQYAAGTSDGTTGTFNGGALTYSGTITNVIDYITIATPANATDFGDLLSGNTYFPFACSGSAA